jgi:hypothetical protein
VSAQRKATRKTQRPAAPVNRNQRRTPAGGTGRPFLTPGASPFRQSVERRSAVALVTLRALPKAFPGLLVLALLAGALVVQGLGGAVLVLLVALLLTWLVYLSWPALPTVGRLVRLAVIVALIVVAATRAL